MADNFDIDKLGKQAVVSFSAIKKKEVTERSASDDTTKDYTKEEMRAKINSARIYANKEIEAYRKAVEEFSNQVRSLTLFKGTDEVVESICINYILDSVIDPILKGNIPYGMPKSIYAEMRKNMYKELIESYVDKKKE